MVDVFISYKKEDSELVRLIVQRLRELELDVWFDHDLNAGERWDDEIEARLAGAKVVLGCWSLRSVVSPWVLYETSAAKVRNQLLPIFLQDCAPPGPMASVQGVRLIGWSGDPADPAWLQLIEAMERRLSRSDLMARQRTLAEAMQKDRQFRRQGDFARSRAHRRRGRILSLDGGGPNMGFTLGVLQAIERKLSARDQTPELFRLSDYYDLIGGSSLGALIAMLLALGMRVEGVFKFYTDLLPPLRASSKPGQLDKVREAIDSAIGRRTLGTPDLRTGLAIALMRADIGRTQLITNNPQSRFWETSDYSARRLLLADIVSAAIGQPGGMTPVKVTIERDQSGRVATYGVFVDGAYSGLANPAMELLSVVTLEPYGLNWPLGRDKLLLTSIGAARLSTPISAQLGLRDRLERGTTNAAVDSVRQTTSVLQMLGAGRARSQVNAEVGDMAGLTITDEPLFTLQRYDLEVRSELPGGRKITAADRRELDELRVTPTAVLRRFDIGRAYAEEQVLDKDFPAGFDLANEPLSSSDDRND